MCEKSAGKEFVGQRLWVKSLRAKKNVLEKSAGDRSVAEKYMVEQFVGIKDLGHGRQEYG